MVWQFEIYFRMLTVSFQMYDYYIYKQSREKMDDQKAASDAQLDAANVTSLRQSSCSS